MEQSLAGTKQKIVVVFKVAVHTCDVLWRKNLAKTHSQASLNTSCIVNLFNPIELFNCNAMWWSKDQ